MRFFKSKRRMVLLGTALLLTILLGTTLTAFAHDWPFGDVDLSNPFYYNIRRIAVLNISPTGCGGGNFCPKANVTREQMAAYMDRFTKAWTDEDEPYIINMDHRAVSVNRPAIVGRSNDGNGVDGISYGAGYADNGVYGETNSTYQYEAGVFGYSTAAAAGVYGRSVTGWGGYFQADNNAAPDLVLGGTSSTNEDGNLWSHPAYAGSDLLFFSNDEVHVHMDENNDEDGNFNVFNGANNSVFRVNETTGWYGDWTDAESDTIIRTRDNLYLHLNDDNSGSVGAIDLYDGANNLCMILADDGNIYKYCGGTSSAVIETSDNVPRRLYVMESPEVWLEDFGFGKLEQGKATVNIEALFLSTINTTDVPYHVFVTPLGDCNGLYVTNKTATSFEVHELGGGMADVEFEYRVIAKRLGWEDARMEPAPIDQEGNPVAGTEMDEDFAAEPIIINVNDGEEIK
jgi:hypothetical protein